MQQQTTFFSPAVISNMITAAITLGASLITIFWSTRIAIKKERRQMVWSKEIERFLALEELSGRLVEELASYRPIDPTQSIRKEYKEVAGRFVRYDPVRKAILTLENTGDRMFVAKRDHRDDGAALRAELQCDLKKLLDACDQITQRGKFLK